MTALLLLKYSVLLATISQRVKARRASKKEGKCDNKINPGPAGPLRARQAEHDVMQPPHPGGRAAMPGGPRHPKCFWWPHLAASVVSSPKCCEGTAGTSRVLVGGLSIRWAPASPPGRGCSSPCSKLLQSRSRAGRLVERPQLFCTPRLCGSQGLAQPSVSANDGAADLRCKRADA